jgi:hypothetical protein
MINTSDTNYYLKGFSMNEQLFLVSMLKTALENAEIEAQKNE